MKINFIILSLLLFLCSSEKSQIPDLSKTKRVEIEYLNNNTDSASVIVSDTLDCHIGVFRQLSIAGSVPQVKRNYNGNLRYFDSCNILLCECTFSIDTNNELQIIRIAPKGRRPPFYLSIPEDMLSVIKLDDPKFPHKYHFNLQHRVHPMLHPLKHNVILKNKGFFGLWTYSPNTHFRIRVIKWVYPKSKFTKNDKMAIKYIAIDSSQAARWYDSIDSIISEPRFLNMDTGIAEVTLQVSTAFRDQMGNHLAGDTLRQWESDNVLSISFLNGDFSVGYWDWEYCKLYFKPEFSNMIKAKSAESKLITE